MCALVSWACSECRKSWFFCFTVNSHSLHVYNWSCWLWCAFLCNFNSPRLLNSLSHIIFNPSWKAYWAIDADTTSFEKMSWFEYWKHAFLKVIRMSSKVLYQHCMLLRYVGIVFWMQKIQRNSSNGQFHCFHYVRKRAPCWKDLFLMETRETKTHFSQCFLLVWPKRGIPWESWVLTHHPTQRGCCSFKWVIKQQQIWYLA